MKQQTKNILLLGVLGVMIVLALLYVSPLSVTSESNGNVICGFSRYYDSESGNCVRQADNILRCEDFAKVYTPDFKTCVSIKGNWNECPQCQKGYICPMSICNASCNTGMKCLFDDVEKKSLCFSTNYIDNDGKCYPKGETTPMLFTTDVSADGVTTYTDYCPSGFVKLGKNCLVPQPKIVLCNITGYKYNSVNKLCEKLPTTEKTCLSNEILTTKMGTQYCEENVVKIVKCSETQVYDWKTNTCQDMTPVILNNVTYNVTAQNKDEIISMQDNLNKTKFAVIIIVVFGVLILMYYLMVRKK